MSTQKEKTASANPAYGSVIGDLEALIVQGSKAAQENTSSLPGSEHDSKTPDSAKGDYPLDPDPVAEAADATSAPEDGDVVKPAVTAGEPEETDAGAASSETPAAETDMVTTDENQGAGKQANELIASIQTAAQKLAVEKKAEAAGNTAPPAEAPNSTDAGVSTAEAAPGDAEDEKLAETIELTNDVLSKIGQLVMDDRAGQKLAIELIQRSAGQKAASEALTVLNGLHASLEQQITEKQAAEDADHMVEVLSKEASEYGMDLPTYLQTLEQGRQKLAAAQSGKGQQKIQAAKQKIAQELEALAAPPTGAPDAPPPEEALAGAIEGAGELPPEAALSEEDALMMALEEMIASGELTEEDLAMLAAEAAGGDPEGGAPAGEEDLAAIASGGAPGEEMVPDAAAADAEESVIPEEEGEDTLVEEDDGEKEAADKLLARILHNITSAKK